MMNNQKKSNTNYNNLSNNSNFNNSNNSNLSNPSSQEKDLMRFGHTISLSKLNKYKHF